MVKTKFKKAVSLMLAAVMSLTAFTGIGATTAFAAVGEKADVYLVDYPRSGDTNNNGEWGHGNLNYMKASAYKHGEVTIKHSSISVLSIDPEELPEESYGETNYELLSDEDFEVNKNLF